MFRRRVFYNAETGAVLRCAMAEGCLAGDYTAEREAAVLGLSGCAYMEGTEPDAAIETAFEPVDADGNPRIVNVSVDVSGAEPQLVFEYASVPEQEQSGRYGSSPCAAGRNAGGGQCLTYKSISKTR